jgi:molybdopterin converting factor small subunit
MNMEHIQIRITPSLTSAIDPRIADWLTLEKETPEEATVGTILKELGLKYPELGRMLFDRESGGVSDGINLVLNGNLLIAPDIAGIKLAGGDTIIILPTYTGG